MQLFSVFFAPDETVISRTNVGHVFTKGSESEGVRPIERRVRYMWWCSSEIQNQASFQRKIPPAIRPARIRTNGKHSDNYNKKNLPARNLARAVQ